MGGAKHVGIEILPVLMTGCRVNGGKIICFAGARAGVIRNGLPNVDVFVFDPFDNKAGLGNIGAHDQIILSAFGERPEQMRTDKACASKYQSVLFEHCFTLRTIGCRLTVMPRFSYRPRRSFLEVILLRR